MDLSSLSNVSNAASGLSGLLVATLQQTQGITAQLNPNPIPITSDTRSLTNSTTFLFHYEGENTITLSSDITDHYVEDNSSRQDQISLKPVLISTAGYIGELNDITPPLLSPLKLIANALGPVSAFAPALTTTATRAVNNATQAAGIGSQLANSAVQAWNALTGAGVQNKQQAAYSMFFGYWQQRQLFSVYTPWAKFTDMAIQTLRAIQDEETKVISTFEITFKQMKFANTTVTAKSGLDTVLNNQAQPPTNLGTSTLNPSTNAFSPSATTPGG